MKRQQLAVVLHHALEREFPIDLCVAALCPDNAAAFLQGVCLLCAGLQSSRQLPLRSLGLLPLFAGQLCDDGADGIPYLLQQSTVIPVLLDEIIQHLAVLNHASGVVGRSLVQGLLVADVLTGAAVLVQKNARLALHFLGHGLTERPVLRGCQLLHTVGPLMAQQEHDRVVVVLLHQDVAAADLGVCGSATHAVHEADTHTQGLCDAVYPVCRRRVHGACHIIVEHKAAVRTSHLCVLRGPPFAGKGHFRVVLARNISSELLRLVELRAVLAAYLAHIHAGHASLVISNEASVETVGCRVAVIDGVQRLCAVFSQSRGRLLHTLDVVYLLGSRTHLCRFSSLFLLGCRRGHGFSCGSLSGPCKALNGGLNRFSLLCLAHILRDREARFLGKRVHGAGVVQNIGRRAVRDAAIPGHFIGSTEQNISARVLRVDGLHIGLVQPAQLRVGDGLPVVELLLELLGKLIAAGGRVAGKALLDSRQHHIVAHGVELCAGLPCAVFIEAGIDGDTSAGHHAAGDSTAQEVQPH